MMDQFAGHEIAVQNCSVNRDYITMKCAVFAVVNALMHGAQVII